MVLMETGASPSPLLRSILERRRIEPGTLLRLVLMIPLGWGVALLGVAGGRLFRALGFVQPQFSDQAAQGLRALFSGQLPHVLGVTLANAIIEVSIFQLLLLSGLGFLVGQISRARGTEPSRRVMWLSIGLQAPVFSLINMHGRQHGIRLVLDAHLLYGVIWGYVYWRAGYEAALVGIWSLVFTVVLVGRLMMNTFATSALPPGPSVVPSGLGDGLISDFEDETAGTRFGMGWISRTDTILEGSSVSKLKVANGGANGSKYSLEISGDVHPGPQYPFAGATFAPSGNEFQGADLSAAESLSFWAKGDGKTYQVLLFTISGGQIPAQASFLAGPTWERHSFSFSEFGTDGHDVNSIFIGAQSLGAFEFQIDGVRFELKGGGDSRE
jgi:hypothetical protein